MDPAASVSLAKTSGAPRLGALGSLALPRPIGAYLGQQFNRNLMHT